MDAIRLFRKNANEGFAVVAIEINGQSLVELVRVHEQAAADRRAGASAAGAYDGMTPSELLSRDCGLIGIEGSRIVQVLQCDGCYEPGCAPIWCRVEMTPDRAIWSDFNDQLSDRRTFDGFGPFVFARPAYDAELAAISTMGGAR